MSNPAILSIGTAVPDNYYDQMEICTRLSSAFNSHRAPAVLEQQKWKVAIVLFAIWIGW